MVKDLTVGVVLTSAAVIVGFAVGFGVGQKSREAAPSNVKADYIDGKVVVVADVKTALTKGVGDWLYSIVN